MYIRALMFKRCTPNRTFFRTFSEGFGFDLANRFEFNRGLIRPFAGIGIGEQIEIKEESVRTYYPEDGEIITSEEFDDLPVSGGIILIRVQTRVP